LYNTTRMTYLLTHYSNVQCYKYDISTDPL
jgi:hypothetical protein